MDKKLVKLMKLVRKLPENKVDEAITWMTGAVEETRTETGSADESTANGETKKTNNKGSNPACPHCASTKIIRYGSKRGKPRYRCRGCGRTFVSTTNTALYYSHLGGAVWKQVVEDTIEGESLDKTARDIGLTHRTVFNMRHKVLYALEQGEQEDPTQLRGVCEFDDTYVLESQKGTPIGSEYWRKARKHGAKAVKRGLSNEQVSICAGVERGGVAYAKSVNRATPSSREVSEVFDDHVAEVTLVLSDGAKSFDAVAKKSKCDIAHVSKDDGRQTDKSFYNINDVNGFHSQIKERYKRYRGVATKYLNRYNRLFSLLHRPIDDLTNVVYQKISGDLKNGAATIKKVLTTNLLVLL